MCVAILFILDVRFVDVPAGVTQEEGDTEFLNLPSAVHTLTFFARRIQSFISLVDREVECCVLSVLTNEPFSTCWEFLYFCIYFCFSHFV